MDIFEKIDSILESIKSAGYELLDIDENCETKEQGIRAARQKFIDKYFKDDVSPKVPEGGEYEDDSDEFKLSEDDIDYSSLPDPFDDEDDKNGKEHVVSGSELVWDDDDFEKIKDKEDKDTETDDDFEDNFDDFEEKNGGSSSPKSGEEDDEDDDFEEDGEEGEEGGKSGKSSKGGKKKEKDSEGGEFGEPEGEHEGESEKEGKSDEKDRKKGMDGETGGSNDENEGGEPGENPIKDALDRVKDSKLTGYDEKKRIEDLMKSLEDGDDEKSTTEKIDENIDEYNEDIKKSSTDIVGSTEENMSDEDLAKEMREHGFSDEDIEKNTEIKNTDTSISDDKLDKIRDEAIKQLEEKCKGKSQLAKSILAHSLKRAKLKDGDWRKILEKILVEKSRSKGGLDSKKRRTAWGHKNHTWRGAILPKVTYETGGDVHKLYCFIDWSGSVKSRPGLIFSFIAKVINISNELINSDVDVYGFADYLSLPRTISHDKIEEDGIDNVLPETYEFIDSQNLGESIENFKVVAEEMIKIKEKDNKAIFLIFGDGIWSLYGNHQPPIRIKEICPQYLDDTIALCFYDKRMFDSYPSFKDYFLKEIEALISYVGLGENVITASEEDMDEDEYK